MYEAYPMAFPSPTAHAAVATDRPTRGVVDAGGGSIAYWGFLGGEGGDDDEAFATPSVTRGKLVVVLCWLAIKEASLLVGQAGRLALPLPPAAAEGAVECGALLRVEQLDSAGRGLLQTLLSTRHNVAIEKSAAGMRE